MKRLDCKVFSSWMNHAVTDNGNGCYRPSYADGPMSLKVVVALNNTEPSSGRKLLKDMKDALAVPTAAVTLSVNRQSLIPWNVSFVGESENKQLLFKQPEGAMSEFMVDGHCNGASTKAMAGADCHELTVLIDQSQSRTSNVGNQERISGRIQFRTPVGFPKEINYAVTVQASP